MRGITIQPPLEFRLEVTGDSFEQGARVPCSLTVKNHGDTVVTLAAPALVLTEANLKKVKAKDEGAFETVASAELEKGVEVSAKSEVRFEHTFELDKNVAITDKSQSPYLLYGNGSSPASLGQVLLTVTPHAHFRSIFDSLTTVFSFVNKGETSKGGWTTVKLKAPDARKFSMVEELNLSCRFDGDVLDVRYLFSVKTFEGVAVMMEVRKGKNEVLQHWQPSDYLFGGGFIRQEYVEQAVDEALSTVTTTI
jgi:hypothetical protein